MKLSDFTTASIGKFYIVSIPGYKVHKSLQLKAVKVRLGRLHFYNPHGTANSVIILSPEDVRGEDKEKSYPASSVKSKSKLKPW